MSAKMFVTLFLTVGVVWINLVYENPIPGKNANDAAERTVGADDRKLAVQYCSMCHLFPEPALLDKKTWLNSVLPNMAFRLGLRKGGDPFEGFSEAEKQELIKLNVYPEKPMISEKDWYRIVKFYEINAPDSLTASLATSAVTEEIKMFQVRHITFEGKQMPQTSMLKYDSITRQLYVGDAQNALYILDNKFEFKSAWNLESPPVDVDFPVGRATRLLTIGSFAPSDISSGRLLAFDTTGTQITNNLNISNLKRPVSFSAADLDLDGKEDLILCNFGNNGGDLSWYSNFDATRQRILKALPGARKVEVKDINKDGKPDLVVLVSQAWEQLTVFYNQGKGKFTEKTLLQFPPVFGASYFEMADFNNDGHEDLLITNGDNWDYSAIDKNYHGVRIYLNDGKNNFKEKWFFPLPGAAKAVARDFDNDGNIDVAAIGFYGNLKNPSHRFVYFANEGDLKFWPQYTSDAASGKWLLMEVADFDNDGDIDIVLGSYLHNVAELSQLVYSGVFNYPQLLVLTNNTK